MTDFNMESIEINVLVVDDNPKNIVAMKKILSDLSVNVHSAESGEEALQLVLRNSYAVIFLDVQMPGMDGYELAEFLSGNKETSDTPIVFLTAIYNDNNNIIKGYDSGAADYVTKPVEPAILTAKAKIFIKLYEKKVALENAASQLEAIAKTDTLTGLSNRYHFNTFFEKQLELCKRHDRKFALIMLDLDNFKFVNDQYGHDAGDLILKKTSKALLERLRKSDMVARLGGDEFSIILTDLESENDVGDLANDLLLSIKNEVLCESESFDISASIGIAIYPFAGDTTESMLKSADIALYRAKEKGKNKFEFYNKSLNDIYVRRFEIYQKMKKALADKKIFLCYQPRINIKDNKVIALEALARWNDEELGEVSPSEFIDVAEDTGLISELGVYLIEKSLRQFKNWESTYPDLSFILSINLSPRQLMDLNTFESIKKVVSDLSLDVSRVEFELTESFFKGTSKELAQALNKISELGILFSIDDFGTGYSSLSRLKLFPIKTLKIDQSFVKGMSDANNDEAIVRAIIALAEALDLEVVAEGVETKAQAETLLKNGCIQAQGFYYAKALPLDEINVLLEKGFVSPEG